jgi:HEAT repeat protein
MNITLNALQYFKQSPPLIQLAWFLSIVFFILILILTVTLKYFRIFLRKKEKFVKFQSESEIFIISYLYAEVEGLNCSPEQEIIVNNVKKSTIDPYKRDVFITTLLKLQKEISGETTDVIQKLYFQTGIANYTISNLNSKKWYILAKSIRELSQLRVKEVHDEIITNLNHTRKEVRKESQLYLVNLFYFKGLDFLDDERTQLSEWDQIQILEALQGFNDKQSFDIIKWLNSPNDSVVDFALKITKIYNQFEAKDKLLDLLNHANKSIRIKVIDVLTHLYVIEANVILKNNFIDLSLNEQIAFFKMLEKTFEPNDEPFLLEQVKHENFEIKLLALRILKKLKSNIFINFENNILDHDSIRIIKFLNN